MALYSRIGWGRRKERFVYFIIVFLFIKTIIHWGMIYEMSCIASQRLAADLVAD